MRMVEGLPCACHGEFWLAHGIRDAGFDVPYSLYIGKCRLIATCPNPNLPVLAGDAPSPTPIVQTSDGKCKIMSMDDEGSHTDFLYGSAWNVNGTGIYGDRAAPGGEWEIARCSVSVDGSDYTLAGNFNEEGTHGEISPLGGDTPARGTYHDVVLSLVATRGTESETLTITLPTFIVE